MPQLSRRLATRIVVGLWLLAGVVAGLQHLRMPLPPHSAHDGFLLVPQLVQMLSGGIPDEARFGMFQATWFSPHAISTGDLGAAGFVQRVFGNVQSHTWIDAPHPLILMALVSAIVGGGTWAPIFIQWMYLGVLIFGLYAIGVRVYGRSAGLMAAVLALGSPAIFGSLQYIEPHLALASMSTLVVALLLYTDGLARPGVAALASLALWSLSRTGEGSGEAVIAGLVVVGPVIMAVAGSDRSLSPTRWVFGLVALVVPFMLLADLPWMVAAMERITRAFSDPLVQADVAQKGGLLAHPMVWSGAYLVLLVTDYLRPTLAVVVGLGLWGLRGGFRVKVRHRWTVGLWLVIPWLALSLMQRKASWYGIALVPSVLLLAGVGIEMLGRVGLKSVAVLVALGQLCLLASVDSSSPLKRLRDPLDLHAWRLRRIDLLSPMSTAINRRVVADLDRVVAWAEEHRGPIALMTMGSKHDYAARYYLSMALGGREVINLGDPRVRAAGYRSLHPGDFSAFVFLDGGAQPWPPDTAQRVWLSADLRCKDDDPFDAFVAGVMRRSSVREDGFYPLDGPAEGVLGPGKIWVGPKESGGLCGR